MNTNFTTMANSLVSVSAAQQARKSYPKLWEEDPDSDSNSDSDSPSTLTRTRNHNITNRPSKMMPAHISPGTEDSFHWARSVPKTSLLSSGLKFTSTTRNESFLDRFTIVLLRSLVIAQQFALSTLFLVANRCVVCLSSTSTSTDETSTETSTSSDCAPCLDDTSLMASMQIFTFTLVTIFVTTIFARRANEQKNMVIRKKRDRIHSRSMDAMLIAGILRFLSSVLRTLTASYSSDTVTALAVSGMILHVFSADYNYANGISKKAEKQEMKASQSSSHSYSLEAKPLFLGGTVSINCVFFSAALLASRLPSDTVSYIFFMWTVVLFAYYPEARYLFAHTSFGNTGELISECYRRMDEIGICFYRIIFPLQCHSFTE